MSKPVVENWDRPPQGKFQQLSSQLVRRRRRQRMLRVGGPVSVAVVLLTVFLLTSRENTYADVTCTRVQQLAQDYGAEQLSPELHDQVSRHVAQCDSCKEKYREMDLISETGRTRWASLAYAEPIQAVVAWGPLREPSRPTRWASWNKAKAPSGA